MKLGKRLYEAIGPAGQADLDRIRYALGALPRVNPQCLTQVRKHTGFPPPYQACLIISADLELAWAWRYVRSTTDTQTMALQKAQQTRQNLPALLALFDRFNVPVTWATVGHLFLESCVRRDGRPHPEVLRPSHFENEYWRYVDGDWFDADPCSDYHCDPAWYAPDLLQTIVSTGVKHEVACHTFSHIDCSDAHCPPEVIDSELAECERVAAEWGITIRSFVFPGNLPGNFAGLKRHGFVAYRWHNGYELDVSRRDGLGLWQIPGGLCWEKPEGWPVDAWIRALQRCVDRALETGAILHLWFHPSCDPINVEMVFPALLDYVAAHRSDLWVTTMAGLVDWLTSAGK